MDFGSFDVQAARQMEPAAGLRTYQSAEAKYHISGGEVYRVFNSDLPQSRTRSVECLGTVS